ncbi:MAG: M1 family metallopeptidase [Algicola sp.]|nr:M1 family metallopeptidase [Algicola sp.]
MKFRLTSILFVSLIWHSLSVNAQKQTIIYKSDGFWQQQADYKMTIDMDVESYQYEGKQTITYTNNSPDVLNRVYYHLYFNAFQPGSEMDARLQSIVDPDSRMANNIGTKEAPVYESRIAKLKDDEIGFIKVNSLKKDGKPLDYTVEGTVMIVDLNDPIQPGQTVNFDMDFKGQVPVQIRRAGRNNKEGVALSMTQWYPKLAEYDNEGWHADPYIAREFYGVWGNFDVKITIDKDYVLGGTGYLENANDIGYGYTNEKVKKPKGKTLTWHFIAPNVHDFTWAADPDYKHDTMQVPNGPLLHFLYKKAMPKENLENWKKMQPKTVELMQYFSEHIGTYPYDQYSVIQGGDGGMEYAMCTLITGMRSYGSLVGVTAHEMAHTWFQFLLATNEAKHEWMDEGFTSYISDLAMKEVMQEQGKPLERAYNRYLSLATSGYEQPLTTHADRYNYNQTYGISAYNKGAVFLAQLGYVIGEDHLKTTIKKYYKDFAFKHPKPLDVIRTAERVSGLELDWYLMDFAQTTNIIDYGVTNIDDNKVTLERNGAMPMPIDLVVTYTDGTTEAFYIPLRMMRGEKPTSATVLEDWAWAFPNYTFEVSKSVDSVRIDPNNDMADVNKENNSLTISE